ncbi:transcriptional regulator [[Actinobacillus] muris]|uniref:Helix-turn-helix domain-containing protein n=2 Tax=Muribacter muris TaxID=67855 RepID=A0A0J5P8Q6_9PAST|nr:transcriptional regulator [[Actinobacillus] muris] [Muribacter muris]MBF0784143.1 helix-turn-helix domain-containing protein [Muribacter muris]MBF0827638.1 helix-turn-helix domain-containing protein [Muribacter muris]TFV13249.1 helix-turn-helix domain-containing protein [Muribacter muris]
MQDKQTRASKTKKMLDIEQRVQMRNDIMKKLLLNQITLGQALKSLRLNLLAVKQEDYAKIVKISRKTLSDLENDKGNYSIEIINQALRPFEFHIGILPINRLQIKQALESDIK